MSRWDMDPDDIAAGLLGLVIGIVLGLIIFSRKAHAQTPQELALARICVHEAGLRTGADCPAIHRVLVRRAHATNRTYLEQAHAYSRVVFDRTRTDARGWIAHLDPMARFPRGFPRRLRWQPERWRLVIRYAQEIVEGKVKADCLPDHWGARYGVDMHRARRFGFRRVDCGETRNAFWRMR